MRVTRLAARARALEPKSAPLPPDFDCEGKTGLTTHWCPPTHTDPPQNQLANGTCTFWTSPAPSTWHVSLPGVQHTLCAAPKAFRTTHTPYSTVGSSPGTAAGPPGAGSLLGWFNSTAEHQACAPPRCVFVCGPSPNPLLLRKTNPSFPFPRISHRLPRVDKALSQDGVHEAGGVIKQTWVSPSLTSPPRGGQKGHRPRLAAPWRGCAYPEATLSRLWTPGRP